MIGKSLFLIRPSFSFTFGYLPNLMGLLGRGGTFKRKAEVTAVVVIVHIHVRRYWLSFLYTHTAPSLVAKVTAGSTSTFDKCVPNEENRKKVPRNSCAAAAAAFAKEAREVLRVCVWRFSA